tara:strand:- start:2934 stop:3359 length:426 start_codon:yes stop_codon:yes gene_type:complete
MDYTSTRLAKEMSAPHSVIVKKLKKYAGSNKKADGGTIFNKNNPNRLELIKLGMGDVEGSRQTIYQFAKATYDACCKSEYKFTEKTREQARLRGLDAEADTSKGLPRYRTFASKATAKQVDKYKTLSTAKQKDEYLTSLKY